LELSIDRCTRHRVIGLVFGPFALWAGMDFGADDPGGGQIAGTPFLAVDAFLAVLTVRIIISLRLLTKYPQSRPDLRARNMSDSADRACPK
jgi:hypothetical protein